MERLCKDTQEKILLQYRLTYLAEVELVSGFRNGFG
jgi:hypothetical protein